MNVLKKFEDKQAAELVGDKKLPDFSPGDQLRVNVKIREGNRERVQAFEGVCISKQGSGVNAKFTVRKISYGEGVERVFPLLSPRIDSIQLLRRGSVRRAKLYYLRERRGKSARITERTTGHGLAQENAAKEAARAEKKAQRHEKNRNKKKTTADKKATK